MAATTRFSDVVVSPAPFWLDEDRSKPLASSNRTTSTRHVGSSSTCKSTGRVWCAASVTVAKLKKSRGLPCRGQNKSTDVSPVHAVRARTMQKRCTKRPDGAYCLLCVGFISEGRRAHTSAPTALPPRTCAPKCSAWRVRPLSHLLSFFGSSRVLPINRRCTELPTHVFGYIN